MSTRCMWPAARLRRLGGAATVAVVMSLLWSLLVQPRTGDMLSRGDFPGFYVLAIILRDYGAAHLYDPELQRTIENKIWPSFEGGFYSSVYPPFTAFLLAPLGWVSPNVARHLFTLFSFACYLVSFHWIGAVRPYLREERLGVFGLSLLCAPVAAALFGGQNSSWSVCCYVGIILMLVRPDLNARRGLAAGLIASLWLYKPQFGIFACSLPLFAMIPGFFSGVIIGGGIFYAVGVALLGLKWPIEWLTRIASFGTQNTIANQPNSVSLLGFMRALGGVIGAEEAGVIVAAAVSLVLVLWGARLFWRARHTVRKGDGTALRAGLIWLGPVVVLCNPQTLFYDLTLLLPSLALLGTTITDRTVWAALGANALLALSMTLRYESPLPLFFFFALYASVKIASALKDSRTDLV